MLLSIAYILLFGLLAGFLCRKIRLPGLIGMILTGILIGPCVFHLLDTSILDISSQIRKIALIIILIRAGLKLSLDDLKKVGRPAILMCFVPATLEILGMVLIAPRLFDISILEAAVLGAVIAAVSPAVIVPGMIKLIDEGRGTNKAIPQMILAGASVDDVFVIVLFTTFTGLMQGDGVNVMKFVNIPISIVVGIIVGMAVGYLLCILFEKFDQRHIVRVLIVLCACLVMTAIEDAIGEKIPFASLIAVMSLGLCIRRKQESLAGDLSKTFDQIWTGAEVFLFVLVGASVQIDSLKTAGLTAILLIVLVLVFRMLGVFICVTGTKLNMKEKLFCMLAYTPKATVQAAIGGVPLAMGLACGNLVLTVSVVAILLTAPIGALMIDLTYQKLLEKE